MASDGDSGSHSSGGGWRAGVGAAGSSLRKVGRDLMDDGASQRTAPVAYKRGGKVKRTGPALTHKNERVIPAGKRKKVERLMKKSRMKMTDKGRKG